MQHLTLPSSSPRRLVFYLSMEEYIARALNDVDEGFFLWQVAPTVIFGRNQMPETEINIPYCQAHDIPIYRRKSGGGCVYSDWGNLMLSYITRGEDVSFLFHRFLQRIAHLLQELNIPATISGRNDILVEGKKISGNAFYLLPNRSIVHGTLLFNTDLEQMTRVLSPATEKLESKGIQSVRQRVTNLNAYTHLTLEELKQHIIYRLCGNNERKLTDTDVEHIEHIEQTYLDPAFRYGHNPVCTLKKHIRLPQMGDLTVHIELKHGRIRQLQLSGDFLAPANPLPELNKRLTGVPFSRKDVQEALHNWHATEVIQGLTPEAWMNLLFT